MKLRLNWVFGTAIALKISDALSLFSECVGRRSEEGPLTMNFLTKFLFTIFTIGVLSLGVSAQRGDKGDKKPPPKPKDSPVVRPGDKPKNPPRDPKKPKRPEEEMSFVLVIDRRKADEA